jgi:hypothetical protein
LKTGEETMVTDLEKVTWLLSTYVVWFNQLLRFRVDTAVALSLEYLTPYN